MYLGFGVSSTDGAPHNVSIYSDISGGEMHDICSNKNALMDVIEWLSGDIGLVHNWTNTNTGDLLYHQSQLVDPVPFAEVKDQAQDAIVFYGMPKVC